jgi:hypothetical protein
MSDKSPEDMTEEELARFFEERRGDMSLWDTSRRIRVRRGSASTVVTVRLAPEELEQLYRFANSEGETMSEFIRRAAMKRASQLERRLRRKPRTA